MKCRVRKPVLVALMALLFALGASINNVASQSNSRGQTANRNESTAGRPAAKYFALIIGDNQYQYLKKLNTAVNDAAELDRVLRETYGFQTKLLLDAGRDRIIDALNEYRANLDEQSYLLIYYAGHGVYDKSIGVAYWLPVDARQNSNARWISAEDVTGNIKGVAAAHVLVISDSCYSGKLNRNESAAILPAERRRFLDKMREGRSRTLIASGGNEPVEDDGGNGHSVFAHALLRGLRNMEGSEFTAAELFNQFILEQVAGKADQTPEYGAIRNSGHDGGDFVFVRSKARAGPVMEASQQARRQQGNPGPQIKPSPETPPEQSTAMENSGDLRGDLIGIGGTKTGTITDGQRVDYEFEAVSNVPLRFVFQKDLGHGFLAQVYDSSGRIVKQIAVYTMRGGEMPFTPRVTGRHYIRLTGKRGSGKYTLSLSKL